MEIEEAIKNLEKQIKCRTEECLGQECREGEGGCPYFVNYDAEIKSFQVAIEWYKNVFAKNKENQMNYEN